MERKPTIIGLFNAIGGLSGLLSISMLFWQGGKLVEKVNGVAQSCATLGIEVSAHSSHITRLDTEVEAHGQRINKVEANGSPGLQKHEALDDQRVADIRQRINRVEDESIVIRGALTDIRGDLREIKAHMGISNGNNNKKP